MLDALSSGGSQLYLSCIIQGMKWDEDVRIVRVSELSDTRLPHASPEWPQQRVGSCAAQYLLSTYLYISTHWVQSWGLACTIFYESLQKYVTSNNDIPISNVRSSDKLIPQLSCVEVCLDRYALMIYDVYDLSSDN